MTTKRDQVYKCELCGAMAEGLRDGAGSLVCCGKPMTALTENSVDASKEKHVPVITAAPAGCKVTVGAVAHPMTPEHFIEWIEVSTVDLVLRRQLKPGQAPEALFPVPPTGLKARAFCNLHGLWKA